MGIEGHAEDLDLGRIVSSRDPRASCPLVGVDEAAQVEGSWRQGAEEAPALAMQLELPASAALGGPEERAAVVEPVWHLGVEIDPGHVALDPQRSRGAAHTVHG